MFHTRLKISSLLALVAIGSAIAIASSLKFNVWNYLAQQTSGYVTKDGRLVFHKLTRFEREFSEGLLYDPVSGYFLDKNGQPAFSQQFADASNFSNGLAAVKASTGLWGFVNHQGIYVAQPIFDNVLPFSEGLAAVKKDELWGYINTKGSWAFATQFVNSNSFHNGLAAVSLYDKVGFINQRGEVAIPPLYDAAWDFADGFAQVINCEPRSLAHHAFYIDTTGKVVFDLNSVRKKLKLAPLNSFGLVTMTYSTELSAAGQQRWSGSFDTQEPPDVAFSEGLLLVKSGDHAVYIDTKGELAIDLPNIKDAEQFSGGLALIRLKNPEHDGLDRSGYIAKSGGFVIPPKFTRADSFSERLAFVVEQDAQTGYINERGERVIDLGHTIGGAFHDGLADVGEQIWS